MEARAGNEGVVAELVDLIFKAGWVPAETKVDSSGVTVRFRDAPYTSDWSGMKTRYSRGSNDLDAYRNFLIDFEAVRRADDSTPYVPDPRAVTLTDFITHPNFWPADHRAYGITAKTNELALGHERLGYDNLIFRMHPETAKVGVVRWVEAGLRDHMPNNAVERIGIRCHPNHRRDYVSLSVVPLDGDIGCI